jgi:hypothetical protein
VAIDMEMDARSIMGGLISSSPRRSMVRWFTGLQNLERKYHCRISNEVIYI